MRRVFISISLFLILALNSNASEKSPATKLFGIKVYDLVDKYSYHPGTEFFEFDNFDKKGLNTFAWMEIENGYFKMQENENFYKYAVYLSRENGMNELAVQNGLNIRNVKIQGIEGYFKKIIFENEDDLYYEGGCYDLRNRFINLYKNKYELDSFDLEQDFFINEKNKEFSTFIFYNTGSFDKINISINFSCNYFFDTSNNGLKSMFGVHLVNDILFDEILNSKNLEKVEFNEKQILQNFTILKGF